MRHLTVALCTAALALPLCAQDKPSTTTTVLTQPPAAQNADSPLVAAAKATKRLNKKPSLVITNDTLAKSGGHMSVANETPNPPPPALTQSTNTPRQHNAALKANAGADAKAKQESAAKKEINTKAAAADYAGESLEQRNDDPAAQEHVMSQMTSTQPQTATSKPPQE